MAELIGGAFLGSLFQELLKEVRDAAVKSVMFKSILASLDTVLNRIKPMIEDMPENETIKDMLEKGLKLVRKCKKIKWYNCVLRHKYAKKIEGIKDWLKEYFQIDLPLQISSNSRKTLLYVSGVDSKLDRLGTMGVGFGGTEGFVGCYGVPGAPEFVVGLDEPLRDLKREAIEGKEKVVVVSAPGGCGKTTLAKMICHDKDIAGKFKGNIFFVTFSKTPNIMVIIKNMFHHEGINVPEFHSEEEAFNQLEQMLRQKGSEPGLIVMDDVWPGSDFYIDKFQSHIPDYKILVTSRYDFPRFFSLKLKLLSDQNAMKLFLHSAFPLDGSSRISVDIANKIKLQMVKGCGGFPLALKVVGRSLCGQAEVIWTRRLRQWSQGQSIFFSNSELLICLQSSIDALDNIDNVKDCFLDLASFPEDHKIPVTTLVDMWAELYSLDDDDALANLYELSYRNLLARKATDENDKYYNDAFVTQHDILRELAIHHLGEKSSINDRLIVEVRGNGFPKWLIELCQQPIYARLVSITTDGPISNWNMELPNVKVLVLNIQAKNDTLPPFMENISHLKTLIITNNDLSSAEISNFSLLGHLQKLKRIRLEHISITSFADSILQMRSLRKLSLIRCKVDEACNECVIQAPDMPDLVELVIDCCSDLEELPTWLCHISSLEKISITYCHDLISLSEEFGNNLENLELLRLNSCTNLMELPESIGNLRKLNFLDLSDCISLTGLPERMGELCSLEKLNMRGCGNLSELPESIKELTNLKYLICDQETAYLWEEFKIYLPDLKIDVIKEVPNLDWL